MLLRIYRLLEKLTPEAEVECNQHGHEGLYEQYVVQNEENQSGAPLLNVGATELPAYSGTRCQHAGDEYCDKATNNAGQPYAPTTIHATVVRQERCRIFSFYL